ncbi:dihydrolipoyl dehydrogenase [Blattabacterium punctulatus CPU2]|uniref:Dihydrolipoyl dehydrogenase n=1 Tax=Blattabacterium punctulatus CPU2 TaxID=1457032 RepID=A0AAD1FRG8_9FLAO|nr:dihydrolipoyl dehydrogenase [Blattabacterium punctulatus]AWU39169.1 dihydrolipoyl dehydrogenase [Blattabacterium punctulatus]BBA17949.1 dihydrolipoyl dehydrogenase [Blattabacterium punctulatus CPU2]
MNNYDVIVIGSGPGGYVSAIRSSQLGLRTAIIEKHQELGGTCLNVGCIPSKSLLYSSKYFLFAKKEHYLHGIFYEKLSLDFEKMMKRKNNIVKKINEGVKYLIKKNKIDLYQGIASFKTNHSLSIIDKKYLKEITKIKFQYCIIATGSKPICLPSLNFDIQKRIISSTEALSLKEIPKRLIVIGGGIIGLELGSIYHRLGSRVTIIETMDKIISNMDHSLSKEIQKILEKSSIQIENSLLINNIEILEDTKEISVHVKKNNGKEMKYIGDYCLLSIGRYPNTKYLGLDNIGIKKDKNGFILVNDFLQSSINNIYAIGDVIGGKMLAHKAEEEGLYVSELISGQKPNKINYNLVPSVIYTYPEVSSVGKTEKEIKEESIEYNIGIFPMKSLGISRASGCTSGFIKILSHKKTDEILGVHMIGEHVTDMIMEATVAMEFHASSEDIYRICHPHPTFSESIKEAALLSFENNSIHM